MAEVVYLLGQPLSHSLSEPMQNAAFKACDRDAFYQPLEVSAGELDGALAHVRQPGCLGANVTLPHKSAAARAVDQLQPPVARLEAANTLVNRGGRLVAHNTDCEGLAQALAELEIGVAGRPVVVLGASGAAAAATLALAEMGAARIHVAARRVDQAARLVERLDLGIACAIDSLELTDALGSCDLLVNATSAGLDGITAPVSGLPRRQGPRLVDMVYRPTPTPLMQMGQAAGWEVHDGLLMLLHQGALAFRLWTGLEAPLAVMRAALAAAAAA